MSYEDTGQFAAAVQRLDDPLNDPLPDRPPAVPDGQGAAPQARAQASAAPDGRDQAPGVPPFYGRPLITDLPSAPAGASAWSQAPGPVAPPAPLPREPFAPPQPFAPPESFAPREWFAPLEPFAPPEPFAPSEAFAPLEPFAPPAPVAPEAFVPPEPFLPPEPFAPPAPAAPEAFAPPAPVAPEPLVPPQPFAPPEPVRPPQSPRRGLAETAQLPVVREPAPAPEPASADEPRLAGAEAATSLVPAPADGGRAARRKAAARQGGGHRARGRGTGPGAESAALEPSAPLSRVEARRAAKAAKDSPSVVISRVVGEVFITTGVIMLLFVTYQLWWTNVRAHQQADSASNKLEQQWTTTKNDPSRAPGTFSPGQGFAIMYIPKLDVKAPIAQGVDKTSVLDKGMIGHYDGSLGSAMPWDQSGNFGVAAHRNTHGEPFRYINRLVPGDKVVVETASTYYTYEVTSSLASTPPTNVGVLQPVPPGSGFTGPGRYLTLTTCTPEFTSTNRLIVWGKLIEERPRAKGKPDALLVKG
jgi:sortase A